MFKNIYKNRPISPHLTIYQAQWTSIPSIFHRITAVVITLVIFIALYVLYMTSLFGKSYLTYSILTFLLSFPIWLKSSTLLLLLSFFFYHILNGMRHLIWDIGSCLNVREVEYTSKLVLFSTVGVVILQMLRWVTFD
nr:succinate dehydrogenase cytochrome B560 subunit [Cavernulicola chilensis]